MNPAVLAMAVVIRDYMKGRPQEAVRPVPLARAVGAKDIRTVRSALRYLRDEAELVSCTVLAGEEQIPDEEFRMAAANIPPRFNREVAPAPVPRAEPRRSSHTSIPSRFTDLPKANGSVASHIVDAIPRLGETPPAEKPQTRRPVPTSSPKRGVWHGNKPVRKGMVMFYILSAGRRVTTSELLDHFRESEPQLETHVVSKAVGDLVRDRKLALAGHVREPRRDNMLMMSYATPEVAARLEEASMMGSVGEGTPPDRAVPAKAAVPAAAPLEALVLEEKTDRTNGRPALVNAREQLDAFFRSCDGNWYGFSWLVRMAGGDVPATLEALASFQRDGRLAYSEADRAPIWHPMEGRW